jgi:sporulation protein YlmC with PRC-barrel domain
MVGIATASLMSSAALAQTAQPKAGEAATTVTAKTTTVTATKWMTQEAPDQWRASKMVGLNIYNKDNEKIGDVAELIVDRSGKLEAVVVGVGGFLGLGEHDVAIPYSQINWIYEPMAASRTSTSATPVSADERVAASRSTGKIPTTTGAAIAPNRNSSYPDHAVLDMTKDQLKAAPAFKFSR